MYLSSQDGSTGSDGTEKSWDHPWCTEEMRNKRREWSLAGDAGLLKHLQRFSEVFIYMFLTFELFNFVIFTLFIDLNILYLCLYFCILYFYLYFSFLYIL